MNDLLFYTLLIAVVYYSLVYLPSQKSSSLSPNPLTHSKSTQTDQPFTEYEPGPSQVKLPSAQFVTESEEAEQLKNLQSQLTTLTQNQAQQEKLMQNLKTSEQKKDKQITEFKQQLTQLTQTHQQEQKDLETTLDQLIKGMTDLNQEIDKY